MKTSASSRRQGIALVLVLAFLALITVFVVGFFSSATGELKSSSSYAASATTRQLADSATNLVMGQIRAATTRHAAGTSPNKPEYKIYYDSWSSQPGMIRTFMGGTNSSQNSAPTAFYKLYSSDKMILEDAGSVSGYHGQNDINPVGGKPWQTQPALFTDLNEPVFTNAPPAETGAAPGTVSVTVPRYPIFDPAAFARFNNENDANLAKFVPSLTAALPVEGAKVVGDQSLSQNFPNQQYSRMPVRWLYTLKDGSMVAPSSSTDGKTAKFNNPGIQPTADNPIVGRIAFWTDDDSCKVNINTAGGFTMVDVPGKNTANYAGSFWDTPRLGTLFDIGSVDKFAPDRITNGLSASQPAAGEFQRYPGHPATTSLGLVFNMLSSEQIYNLAPRLHFGGSLGGITQTKSESDVAIPSKYDRLYSSVDELLYVFDASNNGTVTATQRSRAPQASATKYKNLLPETLDQYRFFLTAHSRAPELNLFGRPRVTLWPVWPIFGPKRGPTYPHTEYNPTSLQNASKTYSRDDFRALCSTQDKLISFCSLVGTSFDDPDARPYIFQRYDPYSSTNDALIPRNRELLAYLAGLTSTPIPGFGGTSGFLSRTGGFDRDQVLAEMFDYIRCVNLQDSNHDTPPSFPPSGPIAGKPANTFKYAPHGIVVPSVLKDYSNSPGFGRFPIISEISIDFYHAGYWVYEPHPVDPGTHKPIDPKTGQPLPPISFWVFDRKFAHELMDAKKNGGTTYQGPEVKGKMIGAFLMLETFNPMQGFSTVSDFDPSYEVSGKHMYLMHRIRGLDKFKIKTTSLQGFQSLQMPGDATNAYFTMSGSTWGGRNSGGAEGFVHPFLNSNLGAPGPDSATVLNAATGSSSTFHSWYAFQSTPDKNNGFPPAGSVLNGLPLPGSTTIDPVTHKAKPGNPHNGVLVSQDDTSFSFQGGQLQIDVKWGQQPDKVLYSYIAKFPDSTSPWPIPTDNIWFGGKDDGGGTGFDSGGFYQGTLPLAQVNSSGTPFGWRKAADDSPDSKFINGKVQVFADYQFYFYKRLIWACWGKAASVALWDPKVGGDGYYYSRRWRQILQPGDTIRSLLPQNPSSKGTNTGDGDMRAMALVGPISTTDTGKKDQYFGPHPYYFQQVRHAETLRCADGTPYIYRDNPAGAQTSRSLDDDSLQNPFAKPGAIYFPLKDYPKFGNMVAMNDKNAYTQNTAATLPPGVNGVHLSDGTAGDFDCGTGTQPDGAYAGKVDEGAYAWKFWDSVNHIYTYGSPYYPPSAQSQASFVAHFSPNRQISSAASFGSLLTSRTKHWQTLAFSPNTASILHPGNVQNPKDHLLLDLFTMPVVEPYAISEPFSTAGKINLNYPIEPFGYIKRTTALRAALQPLRVTALPAESVGLYKGATPTNYRYPVDRDMTIGMMDKFFYGTAAGNAGGLGQLETIFRSASQICEIYLVPQGPNNPIPVKDALKINTTIMRDWWKLNPLTADNMREKPYVDLYPRITTKSNTFTVYMRVQVLRKVPVVGTPAEVAQANSQWTEGKDQVLSEYRGSSTIERYLDPADPRINGRNPESRPDGINPDSQSLEPAYKFRVVESKRFRP